MHLEVVPACDRKPAVEGELQRLAEQAGVQLGPPARRSGTAPRTGSCTRAPAYSWWPSAYGQRQRALPQLLSRAAGGRPGRPSRRPVVQAQRRPGPTARPRPAAAARSSTASRVRGMPLQREQRRRGRAWPGRAQPRPGRAAGSARRAGRNDSASSVVAGHEVGWRERPHEGRRCGRDFSLARARRPGSGRGPRGRPRPRRRSGPALLSFQP